MKKTLLLTSLMLVCSISYLFAQMENKHFISGTAGINFTNSNPDASRSANNYGYNFNIGIGKFKTNSKAVGWQINSSLGAGKTNYSIMSNNSELINVQKNGINDVGIGVGRFWQYYKHFNDKIGLFAGPDIDLAYTNSRKYELGSDNTYLAEIKTNMIQLSAGLSAGIYYHFSEKWWVTASLAFSNPISVNYSFATTSGSPANNMDDSYETNQLNYSFSPNFTFPSVGFGLRYFYNR